MGRGSGFEDARVGTAVKFLIQNALRQLEQKQQVGMTDEEKKEVMKKRAEEEMRMQEQIRKREAEEHERLRKHRERKKKKEAEAKQKAKYERMSEGQREAHILKDEGNTLFAAGQKEEKEGRADEANKQYEAAIKKYTEAHNKYGNDVTFLSNRSAVHYKMKNFDLCLQDLNEAVKIADEESQDFTIMSRIFGRMGHIHRRNGDLDSAIKFYEKSLTEKHSDSIYKIRKQVVKKRDQAKREAYFDADKALEAKERGNDHFRNKNFREAIKEYSEAIARDPKNSKFYSNRAAAYQKCAEFGPAMDDCLKAVDLDETNVKAWGRMGDIHFFLKEYHKSQDAYKKGIEVGQKNGIQFSQCTAGLQKVESAIAMGLYGARDEVRAKRGLADPEIQKIMNDPVIRKVLEEMSTDPNAMNKHMQNPGDRKSVV